MDNITFKQFIYAFNFRYFQEWDNKAENYDTDIIRIYLPSEEIRNRDWFEFGIYDFSHKENTIKIMEKTFSKDIMGSYVETIQYNNKLNIVEVYLTSNDHYID